MKKLFAVLLTMAMGTFLTLGTVGCKKEEKTTKTTTTTTDKDKNKTETKTEKTETKPKDR